MEPKQRLTQLKQVHLPTFCTKVLNYEVHPGTSKRWPKLTNPITGRNIVINMDAVDGVYFWRYQDDSDWHTVIDLLCEEHGYTSIPDMLSNFSNDYTPVARWEHEKKGTSTEEIETKFKKFWALKPWSKSLLSLRNISIHTLEAFVKYNDLRGGCFKDGKHVCAVPLYKINKDKEFVGMSVRSQYAEQKSETRIWGQKGIARLIPNHFKASQPSTMYIVEDVLDALSYYQLDDNLSFQNCFFVCTMGTPGALSMTSIEALITLASVQKLVIAMDNDDAGERYTKQLTDLFSEKVPEIAHFEWLPFKGIKDFNELIDKI